MRVYRPGAGSLAFPIGIAVYCAYKLAQFTRFGIGLNSGFLLTWGFAAGIVFGGVLPIILTFALKIDTREYFLPRLILYVCTIAAISLPRQFVEIPQGGAMLMCAFSSALTLLYFYKIRPARFKEWCVIALSTPQIYMMIYYLLLSKAQLTIYI